jgi:Protein of unknown function (DUF732)
VPTYFPTFGCIAVGMTLAFLGAPTAQADNESFVRSAQDLGLPFAAPSLIATARSACNMLWYNNRPVNEIEGRILRYTRAEPEQAHQFFVLAVNEYCPQYAGVVGT